MTEAPRTPSPATPRWSSAIGPLVLGVLLIIGPGACAVSSIPALSDPAGSALGWLAIYACAPLIAAGAGLAVLALSRAYGEPGKPPAWRVLAGWLLVFFAIGYLALPVLNEFADGEGDIGGAIFAVALMAIPAAVVAWLGLALARPGRG